MNQTTTTGIDLDAAQLDKLEALARAADDEAHDRGEWFSVYQLADGITLDASAALIAEANPATVLQLIQVARRSTRGSAASSEIANSEHAASGSDGIAAAGVTGPDTRHPVQPLVTDPHGRLRFKRNAIVDHLTTGKLNDLAAMDFPQEDWEQLAQLIGYSLDGFGTLSYVTDETYDRAATQAATSGSEQARASQPAATVVAAEEIQWRNIQKVVRELAAFCFGSASEDGAVTLGAAYLSLVTALTSKDGLRTQLEPLVPPAPTRQPLADERAPLMAPCEGGPILPDSCSDCRREGSTCAIAQPIVSPAIEPRDWIEDASHENGNYQCKCSTCGNLFVGYKRRVICKSCAQRANSPAIEQQGGETAERDDRMWDTNTVMSYLATLPGAIDRTRAENVDDVLNALILMHRELPAAPTPAADAVRDGGLLKALRRARTALRRIKRAENEFRESHEIAAAADKAATKAIGAYMSASQAKTQEAK